jgi:hypothetical protein
VSKILSTLTLESYSTILSNFTQQDILQDCILENDTNCWIWKGPQRNKTPVVIKPFGLVFNAIRVAWMVFGRGFPKDHSLRNICGNKFCVNPYHRELYTLPGYITNQRKEYHGT